MWNDINWGATSIYVRRIQNRIYKAKSQGDKKRMQALQNFLINSIAARLIAVKQVTTLNQGKKTPGVDKQVVTTPTEKMQLVRTLKLDGTALPIRRVWIPKPGKTEKRPLGIPVIKDRAKQALVKLALEPEWEAVFEPNSYGFRPGRRTHDAIEAIFKCVNRNTQKWVYDADIKKCFDTINHEALLKKLETSPIIERQVKAWLKAGVMERYANDTTDVVETAMGTPQGGVISPLLANIALHGLENHLMEFVSKLPMKPHPGANRGKAAKVLALGFVRYADDFVIIHRNREILELCIEQTHVWLSQMGLVISTEKSKIKDTREGFNFLGFQIITVRKMKADTYKVKITPTKNNCEKLLSNVREVLQRNKAISTYQLIRILKPKIMGWANYYKYCECQKVFSKMDFLIFQKLRAWVFRRDTKNGRKEICTRYFPQGQNYTFQGRLYRDSWVLVRKAKNKKGKIEQEFLPKMSWFKSERFTKIKGNASPYDGNKLYWAIRTSKYSLYSTTVTKLLKTQNGKCTWCKLPFTIFDEDSWEVDHIKPKSLGGKSSYDNLQLLHKTCHLAKTRTDGSLDTR